MLSDQVVAVLGKSRGQGFNYKQVAKRLNITDAQPRQMISDILRELARQGVVQEIFHGKYRIQGKSGV